jgi:hypothetical protein
MMPAIQQSDPKVPAELVMLSFTATFFLGIALYAWA